MSYGFRLTDVLIIIGGLGVLVVLSAHGIEKYEMDELCYEYELDCKDYNACMYKNSEGKKTVSRDYYLEEYKECNILDEISSYEQGEKIK